MAAGDTIASPPMSTPTTLADWLAHCERLHPKTIDLTLERMQVMRERLDLGSARRWWSSPDQWQGLDLRDAGGDRA